MILLLPVQQDCDTVKNIFNKVFIYENLQLQILFCNLFESLCICLIERRDVALSV